LILSLALLALIGLGWGLYFFADFGLEPVAEDTPPSPKPSPAPVAIPDLPTLASAAMQGGVGQSNPNAAEAEKQLETDQVAFAGHLLQSQEAASRAAGVEQLSAYPTEAAEKLLVSTLIGDIDPAVRAMAAKSLAAVKKPKPESVEALLNGMADSDKTVQISAWNTVLAYMGREPFGSERAKKILNKLRQLEKSSRLQADLRKAVRVLLAEQAAASSP